VTESVSDIPLLAICAFTYTGLHSADARFCTQLMYWVFDDEDDSFPNEPEPRFLEPLDPAPEKEIIVPDVKPDPRFHPVGHIGKLRTVWGAATVNGLLV
jgi:hypothetical protein